MQFSKIKPLVGLQPNYVADAVTRSLVASELGIDEAEIGQALGRVAQELAGADDYCAVPWMQLEEHRLHLRGDMIGAEAIHIFLQRLVHAPRNSQVLEVVLKAASREVEEKVETEYGLKKRKARRPLIDGFGDLAQQLTKVQGSCSSFVHRLLSGDLAGALALLPADGWPELNLDDARDLVRDMAVVWSFHDLQVIGARLFQSIWMPSGFLAQEEDKPATGGTIAASVKEIRRALAVVKAALRRNHRPMNANEYKEWRWFEKFVEQHNLVAVAEAHGKAMGLTDEQLAGDFRTEPEVMRAIEDVLKHGERRIGRPVAGLFAEIEHGKAHTAADLARWKRLRSKPKAGASPAPTPSKKALAKMGVSHGRYGMQPTVAMAYAVICFVAHMERIKETIADAHEAVLAGKSFELSLHATSFTHAQGRTIDALLEVYRAAIVRDPSHLAIDGSAEKDAVCPAVEAIGHVWSSAEPLLPATGKRLTHVDAVLGRGVSLEDKLPNLDPFSYDPELGDSKQRGKRPGRDAIDAAKALLAEQPLNLGFDLSLGWRLSHSIPPIAV